MTQFDAEQVGIVGSPSSTNEITLDVVGDASERELLGSMVMLEQDLRDYSELALGTVAEVTTSNQWHENIAMRGVISQHGPLPNLSGRADVRSAKVALQAVYRRDKEGATTPAGATLSMSPSTGSTVMRVTDKDLHSIICRDEDDLFYLGDIYRMSGVRLPLNPSDFSGKRGAFHAGVFGPSGVGKSVFALYYLAGQMRHSDLGVFIVDPQGQFSIERPQEIPFSLQGFARGMGREVIVKSLSTELRLPQDKGLFVELLAKTAFFKGPLRFRYQPALEAALEAITDLLGKTKGWADQSIDDLLQLIIDGLIKATEGGEIYKIKPEKDGTLKPEGSALGLLTALQGASARDDRWDRLFKHLEPVASLFNKYAPDGTTRMGLERLLHQALEREEGKPRPLVILNMAFGVGPGADDELAELIRKLNGDDTKARILRTLFDRLERIAVQAYNDKESQLLNTVIVFDEAWRYAPKSSSIDEVKQLSNKLAEYARETRKTGVGWMYILQSPHSLHPDVWDQLKSGFRALGYGLTGGDLELVKQQVDRPESIQLYRSFPQPSDQNPQYPFMLVGAISPLSFSMAPLYTSIFTSFERWCDANAEWLPPEAVRMATFSDASSGGPTSLPASSSSRAAGDMFV